MQLRPRSSQQLRDALTLYERALELVTPSDLLLTARIRARGFTLHGVRWDHALYAGSQMFGADFTRHTEVFLIEAQEFFRSEGLQDSDRKCPLNLLPDAERGGLRVNLSIASR